MPYQGSSASVYVTERQRDYAIISYLNKLQGPYDVRIYVCGMSGIMRLIPKWLKKQVGSVFRDSSEHAFWETPNGEERRIRIYSMGHVDKSLDLKLYSFSPIHIIMENTTSQFAIHEAVLRNIHRSITRASQMTQIHLNWMISAESRHSHVPVMNTLFPAVREKVTEDDLKVCFLNEKRCGVLAKLSQEMRIALCIALWPMHSEPYIMFKNRFDRYLPLKSHGFSSDMI